MVEYERFDCLYARDERLGEDSRIGSFRPWVLGSSGELSLFDPLRVLKAIDVTFGARTDWEPGLSCSKGCADAAYRRSLGEDRLANGGDSESMRRFD